MRTQIAILIGSQLLHLGKIFAMRRVNQFMSEGRRQQTAIRLFGKWAPIQIGRGFTIKRVCEIFHKPNRTEIQQPAQNQAEAMEGRGVKKLAPCTSVRSLLKARERSTPKNRARRPTYCLPGGRASLSAGS
jgi:hypothetical protein